MVDAEFNNKDIGIDRYRKTIERKLKVLKTKHGSTLPSPLRLVNFITTFSSPLSSSLSNSNSSSMTRTTTMTVTTTKSTSSIKTSKQVVKENAVKSIEKQNENEALQMALSRWEREKKTKIPSYDGCKTCKSD